MNTKLQNFPSNLVFGI